MEAATFMIVVLGYCIFLSSVVEANVRLANGLKNDTLYFGVLQVYHNSEWGTVCDDGWNINNTKVVCRQLGYKQGIVKNAGTGSGRIWLDDVVCTGNEDSVLYCRHTGWGTHDCSHSEDIGVVCYSDNSTDLAFRWANNPYANAGRLQVRYHGIWGALCADNVYLVDGHVICRMVGYSQALAAFRISMSASAIKFSLTLRCNGNENSTKGCYSAAVNKINTCDTSREAYIVCKSASGDAEVALRLKNGTAPNEGRVEVRYYGVWGTVCDDGWGLADAHVVCRMLNYSKALWAGTAKVRGRVVILLDDVACRGNENSLGDCRSYGWGRHNCDHSEDAGVKCGNVTQEELSVTARLVEREGRHTGFVEVNYNGTWRPMCDDTWDISDAHVVCRMLGHKAALAPLRHYRKGINGLWMGGVECSGDEVSIGECYHRGWTNTRCPGNYYAGVMCKITEEIPPMQMIRLEDKRTPDSGRVAVRFGNIWGSICGIGLDRKIAQVICRMFGYPGVMSGYRSPGNGTIWLSKLKCNGTENSIGDCRHPGWGQTAPCTHNDDIGVNCKRADPPGFQISGTNAITESTVVILFNDSRSIDSGLKSVYQVAVEKRDNEKRFKSYEHPPSFVFNDVNVTMVTQIGNTSYNTMEIPSSVSNLTIGDGQYYHGYYNAPLEPGSMYRVHARIVTMAMEGERVDGHSAFVAFTTKSESKAAVKGDEATEKEVGDHAVISLSVTLLIFVCVIIGLISYFTLKLKKTREKYKSVNQPEMAEIVNSADSNGQYEFRYQPAFDRKDESSEEEEYRDYENIPKLGNQRYRAPKPVSTVAPHTVDEDFYENI